ncbi:MAG: hypothetical protein Q7R35_00865 [Elusimicrobiota bacterium]|nr:hypothetical protein [Elusimicrobiota bacterium]
MKTTLFLLPAVLFIAACSNPSSNSETAKTETTTEDSVSDDILLKDDRYAMFESKTGNVFLFDKVKGAV